MRDDVDRLDHNWWLFTRQLARSGSHLRHGRHEQAAVAAMSAATLAWCNPSGVFASPRLEDVLADLGAALPPAPAAPERRGSGGSGWDGRRRPRVLHVASQLYDTGGHTQMLANWVRLDRAREHHVCVTGQEGRPVPDKVTSALCSPEGLTLLDVDHPTLMGRAAALRELVPHFDHVLLHVHPNDVVACIALAGRSGGPEVLLVNHADHVFWVGASVADRVVNLRHSGARLNVVRRGLAEDRNALLVRPLHLRPRELSRDEAKTALGIEPGAILVVSAADTYKYGAAPGAGLMDALVPALRSHPGALLHVAGPLPDGEWALLAEEGLGRAHGLLPDVRTLLEAADVYVDSYPFSSLTSMLEAASLDTPVVTRRQGDGRLEVLEADTPELDDHLVVARSAEELAEEVSRLLRSPQARARLGEATGAAVRRAHAGGAWEEQVDTVLAAPPAAARRPAREVVRGTGPLDVRLLQVMQHSVGQGLAGTLVVMAPLLPWRQRVTTAALLAGDGRWPSPALLLPAGWVRRLRFLREGRRASSAAGV